MGVYRNIPRGGGYARPGDAAPGRHTNFGDAHEVMVGLGNHNVADEGSYFTAITPTPGTGIIDAAVVTFAETTPSLTIYNGSSDKRLVLDFIRFTVTVVSTNATPGNVAFTNSIDAGHRWTSGGTSLTINGAGTDAVVAPAGISIRKGAIAAKAATGDRKVISHTIYRWAAIEVVGDVYEMVFGRGYANSITNVATVGTFSRSVPPVVIGPNQSFVQVNWATDVSTGATHAVELGYWLR